MDETVLTNKQLLIWQPCFSPEKDKKGRTYLTENKKKVSPDACR